MDNCIYCGTRLFPEDRRCPSCGGPIYVKVNHEIKELNDHYNRYPLTCASSLSMSYVETGSCCVMVSPNHVHNYLFG
jgi:hypothetical protein